MLHCGDIEGARAITQMIRQGQIAAREQQNGLEILSPSEDVLCKMVELATSTVSNADWDALEERSAAYSFGQERIEVVETHALWAMRQDDLATAERCLEKAIALSGKVKTVMVPRLEGELAVVRRRRTLGELALRT
jgi:eukaryotic-like serine/threonine-protein kinase